jgi:hypothetical protein
MTSSSSSVPVRIFDNGILLGTVMTADRSWVYTVSSLSDGIHVFTAETTTGTSREYQIKKVVRHQGIRETLENLPSGDLKVGTPLITPQLTSFLLIEGRAVIGQANNDYLSGNTLVFSTCYLEISPDKPVRNVSFAYHSEYSSSTTYVSYYSESFELLDENRVTTSLVNYFNEEPIKCIRFRNTLHVSRVDDFTFRD